MAGALAAPRDRLYNPAFVQADDFELATPNASILSPVVPRAIAAGDCTHAARKCTPRCGWACTTLCSRGRYLAPAHCGASACARGGRAVAAYLLRSLHAYHEFNFSPSGEWAAYAFHRYRERAGDLPQLDPGIAARVDAARLDLTATIVNSLLPTTSGALRVGLCAVIEDAAGALSYWALKHAADKPDFHQRTAFAVELA